MIFRMISYSNFPPDSEAYDLHENELTSHEGRGKFSTNLYSEYNTSIMKSAKIENHCRKAVEIILKHNKSLPLFLYLAFQAPSMNLQKPPEKYLKIYRNKNNKMKKIYQEHLLDDHQALYRAAAITVSPFYT